VRKGKVKGRVQKIGTPKDGNPSASRSENAGTPDLETKSVSRPKKVAYKYHANVMKNDRDI
jgi:hypothetical protein